MQAAAIFKNSCLRILAKKVFTQQPLMTTLYILITQYLRGYMARISGVYQLVAPIICAQAAIKLIAIHVLAELTPARPIHAPTLSTPA